MKALVLTLPLIGLLGLVCSAAEQAPPRHLADALDLVRHLKLENTSYGHGDGYVRWTGSRQSHTDCSGFLDGLLMHSYGYSPEDFKRWFDSHRPSARRYHEAIVEGKGFVQISDLRHVRPGDILAVKYLGDSEDTGHVMLVADAPRRLHAKRPLVANTEQWEVTVIDSSKSAHGPRDTRHAAGRDGKDHQGLGAGILRIYTDKQDRVAGYSWSTLDHSKFVGPEHRHMVIGRLVPSFRP